MNYAVRHYRLAANPCHAAGSMGRGSAGTMKIWTQEEYERFSKCIKKSAMRLAFDILFYTGVRSGELLALTEPDILPTKKISINKNYAKVDGEELFLEPKTPKANRTISIPDFLYDDIMNYIARLGGLCETDRIFYFTKSTLDKEIKTGAKAAGLTPIRVHDLRHSHASMLVDMGFPVLEISERLGHESVKTTLDTYSHLYPEKDSTIAGRLNELRRK